MCLLATVLKNNALQCARIGYIFNFLTGRLKLVWPPPYNPLGGWGLGTVSYHKKVNGPLIPQKKFSRSWRDLSQYSVKIRV
jgi:hypothetical protein